MKNKVSVVLPTFNEAENIEALIRGIYRHTGKDLFEIIVVDDDSPDKTSEIIKGLQKEIECLKLIVRKGKRGLPSAVWRGIKEAEGDVIVWLDCDLSHPPDVIPRLLGHIKDYDVVCASRYAEGGKDTRSVIRVATSKIINLTAQKILGLKIKDLTSGFYAVRKKVFSKVKLMQTGFAEYLIRFSYDVEKNGFSVLEIGYVSPDRERGTSKSERSPTKFLHDGYRCWKEIIKLGLGK